MWVGTFQIVTICFLIKCVVGGSGGGGFAILDVSSAVRALGFRGASHSLKNGEINVKT